MKTKMSEPKNSVSRVDHQPLVVPLPCPFCGCELVRVLECIRISVGCDLCRAHGPAAKTEADAVEQWNRYANATRDLREALRKAIFWGESASQHFLYREKINWRYLEEARETLASYSLHNVQGDGSPDTNTRPTR